MVQKFSDPKTPGEFRAGPTSVLFHSPIQIGGVAGVVATVLRLQDVDEMSHFAPAMTLRKIPVLFFTTEKSGVCMRTFLR